MDVEVKEVLAACEALRSALLTADRAKLDGLCAEALSYGHSAGKVETKVEFIAANVADPPIWKSISLSGQTVHISGDTAIARHTMSAETQREGKSNLVKISVLLIWQKLAGSWKLIARQAVRF